ncbi:MAG TPA: polymer-forming cytoskeletal protein [Thermoanaerobaculia bacterium]|nr:polymer-forming cytoskeletal protein [Thermoanaerobaculia bacterium]
MNAVLAAFLLLASPAPAEPLPALRLDAGSSARHQLVAIGRDLIVAGEALEDVAAVNGSVEVSGQVEGDVVVLGGDARLLSSARIGGDVHVLGGIIRASPGARVLGRMVSYPTASAAAVTLLEGPSLGLSFSSPLVLGTKLALLAAWAALLLLLFAASGRQVLETADEVRREPFRSFFVGLTGLLALVLTGLLFSAFTGGLVALPLLVLVVLLALLLKLWGMIAVFYALGEWLARTVRRRPRPLNAATLGLLLMGALKFLPWVGVWAWTAASLIGIGASLSSKFGRREPWFELA